MQPAVARSRARVCLTGVGAFGWRLVSSAKATQALSFWPSAESDMPSFSRLSGAFCEVGAVGLVVAGEDRRRVLVVLADVVGLAKPVGGIGGARVLRVLVEERLEGLLRLGPPAGLEQPLRALVADVDRTRRGGRRRRRVEGEVARDRAEHVPLRGGSVLIHVRGRGLRTGLGRRSPRFGTRRRAGREGRLRSGTLVRGLGRLLAGLYRAQAVVDRADEPVHPVAELLLLVLELLDAARELSHLLLKLEDARLELGTDRIGGLGQGRRAAREQARRRAGEQQGGEGEAGRAPGRGRGRAPRATA